MKQFYSHYQKWEDYNNGMYSLDKESSEKEIENCRCLLKDTKEFLFISEQVIKNWKICSKVNLTNRQINRNAWLGAVACNYKYKATEISVRIAWNSLSNEEKKQANSVADFVIRQFEWGVYE
jgi:hypothetical protein